MTGTDATIFALSSGQPPAAIAVIRLSGPRAWAVAEAITGRPLPPPRRAALRRFRDPASGEILDDGLVLCFTAQESVTGEPLVELHCHGARAVVRDISAVLSAFPGMRAAEAGDFTRRAFANGRMDLAGVEGLGDLLAAETSVQRRAAIAMLGGALSRKIEDWTRRMRRLAAHVEAVLDFSDEGDVGEAAPGTPLSSEMAALSDELGAELARPGAECLRDGIRVVIAGPPNAGKSTLLNALAGRDAAIVSPIAGTTRDIIEVPMALGGLPLLLSDTAGLRSAGDDPVERIGIERAGTTIDRADILLWLGAPGEQPVTAAHVLPIFAKADLAGDIPGGPCAQAGLRLSAVTGEGMDELRRALGQIASTLLPAPGDYALSTRQRAAMARAQATLAEGATLGDEILIGETLRVALAAMDELTGRVTTEAVLDELFAGFCIGK